MTRNEKMDNKIIEIVNENEKQHKKNESTSMKKGVSWVHNIKTHTKKQVCYTLNCISFL